MPRPGHPPPRKPPQNQDQLKLSGIALERGEPRGSPRCACGGGKRGGQAGVGRPVDSADGAGQSWEERQCQPTIRGSARRTSRGTAGTPPCSTCSGSSTASAPTSSSS